MRKDIIKKYFHGFTLAELIVVITILAILGTIAFVSFKNYSSSARDSVRISDIKNIEVGLNNFQVVAGSYPVPDNIIGTGTIGNVTLSYLGEVGDNISRIIKISKIPTDPQSSNKYPYGLTSDKTQYQIATTLENNQIVYNFQNTFLNKAYAATDYEAKVVGNYKGYIKYYSGVVEPRELWLANIPSLIFTSSGTTNLLSSSNMFYVINKGSNLPYKLKSDDVIQNKTGDEIIKLITSKPSATLTGIKIESTTLTGIALQFTGSLLDSFGGNISTIQTIITGVGISSVSLLSEGETFTCSGTAPTPAAGLIQSTTTPTSTGIVWTYSGSTSVSGPACTWKCDTGYVQSGNSCIAYVPLYVDDVFSTYLYNGNGSSQIINNGIDLAGQGGLVWSQIRSGTIGSKNGALVDTVRGKNSSLVSNTTDSATAGLAYSDIASFNSNGFNLNYTTGLQNSNGNNMVSWTFRKAPKFFDIVSWTGSATSNRKIPHNLGIIPGMVIVKATSTTGKWIAGHRSSNTVGGYLNETTALNVYTNGITMNATDAATNLTVSDYGWGADGPNGNNISYVAYVFAHDPSPDGIIQAGSFTTDSSGNASVNLGWEPQYLLTKSSTTAGTNWNINDVIRGLPIGSNPATLFPNLSIAEGVSSARIAPTANGFIASGGWIPSSTYIYLAIRRPNKPVINNNLFFDNKALSAGTVSSFSKDYFDLIISNNYRSSGGGSYLVGTRLLGIGQVGSTSNCLNTASNLNETTVSANNSAGLQVLPSMFSINNSIGANLTLGNGNVAWGFRRSPGVFDVVGFSLPSGTDTRIKHTLGVIPELIITKDRTGAGTSWNVYYTSNIKMSLTLNSTAVPTDWTTSGHNIWGASLPTTTDFGMDGWAHYLAPGDNFVAYLFASKPNISKVGSYSTTGGDTSVDCGFDSAPRFLMVKRTDNTGDWYVWDSARGFDKRLSLNTTAAEVTGDTSVTTTTSGFIAKSGGVVNANPGSYIYLCIH